MGGKINPLKYFGIKKDKWAKNAKGDITLYHGSRKATEKDVEITSITPSKEYLKRHGFEVFNMGGRKPTTFLTPDPKEAIRYGKVYETKIPLKDLSIVDATGRIADRKPTLTDIKDYQKIGAIEAKRKGIPIEGMFGVHKEISVTPLTPQKEKRVLKKSGWVMGPYERYPGIDKPNYYSGKIPEDWGEEPLIDTTSTDMAWKYPEPYEYLGKTYDWTKDYTKFNVPIESAYHMRAAYNILDSSPSSSAEEVMKPQYGQMGNEKSLEPERYVEELKEAINAPDPKVPVLRVRHSEAERGIFGEGRHRILAAKRAGLTHIPILVEKKWNDPNDERLAGFGIKENPLIDTISQDMATLPAGSVAPTQGMSTAFPTATEQKIFGNPFTQQTQTTITAPKPATIQTPKYNTYTTTNIYAPIKTIVSKPTTTPTNIDAYAGRITNLENWQRGITTRTQQATDFWKAVPGLSGPSGTTWKGWTGGSNYWKEFGREVLSIPQKIVTTLPESIAFAGGKLAAIGEGVTIPETRKNILPEMSRAITVWPSTMKEIYSPQRPQGIVNTALTLGSISLIGKELSPTPGSRYGSHNPQVLIDAVKKGQKPMTELSAKELKGIDLTGLKKEQWYTGGSGGPSYIITKAESPSALKPWLSALRTPGFEGDIKTGQMLGFKPWEINKFVTETNKIYYGLPEQYITTTLRSGGVPTTTAEFTPLALPALTAGVNPINTTNLTPTNINSFKERFLDITTTPFKNIIVGTYRGVTTPSPELMRGTDER